MSNPATVGGCSIGASGPSSISRANVSVTSINCENSAACASSPPISIITPGSPTANDSPILNNGSTNHFYGSGSVGIRISVPKMEESDESETELSNIENTSKVNMRTNRTNSQTEPRPMSWEGELSEPEDGMDAENTSNSIGGNTNPPTIVPYSSIETANHLITLPPLLTKETIKPEHETGFDTAATNVTGSFTNNSIKKLPPDLTNLKCEPGLNDSSNNSPLLARSKATLLPANSSPDSAIHSVYTHSSPSQSPLTSRHTPYTPSLSRNNSDASHSSCYSYSSEFSPTHSPIQSRHNMFNNFNGSPLHHSVLYRPMIDGDNSNIAPQRNLNVSQQEDLTTGENETIPSAGISRQQLINSPCPICGDKISGFHYGIFSCESCKGFFKRTVQNRKNYVCLRGAVCPVTIATRKKCPACRFEKCLQRGMKLEAIREDRTRGGRSTYQCSYTLPNSMLSPPLSADGTSQQMYSTNYRNSVNGPIFKVENSLDGSCSATNNRQRIPTLLQEIMDVEHLWQYNESELNRLNQMPPAQFTVGTSNPAINPLLASANLDSANPDLIANLCNVADHRLYKIVKWCKSLPLFKHISIDDQICLLINSWCELLLFSCCFRSMTTPGEVRISLGKSINLVQAKSNGLHACIERMLNLTDHLRRLRVDKYEYVAMKVIVLLQSDTSELRESEKVRASQEKALQALQAYTLAHYPDSPAKFGELLLRIPELQRTCQVGKEMLTIKSKDGEDFNLLMELLRGEH